MPAQSVAQPPPAVRNDEKIVLEVSDTGVGIATENLKRIFDPFFTTKPVGRGTGLGLAMAYGFVKQSRGCINVQSELGEGTTFRLYFPRVQRPAAPVPVPDRPPLQQAHPKAGTVLVVEDEPSVRRLTVDTFREMGYQVLEAGSGKEALPIGEHYDGPIEILVTDIVMPDMNGLELAERVVKARPQIKVLYVSGYAVAALKERGILSEPANLLSKPFSAEALSEAVGRLVAERGPEEHGEN
jgi:CheY-like chemotaxis protein